jgi:hypothetical protein
MNAQLSNAGLITAIQSRIPWDDYLVMPGCSISRLKELRRSPQHYRYLLEHPKESAPLTLGRAAHCAVLEPERFDRDHAVWDRRTESGNMAPRNGKWWDAFKLEHDGKTIITADEFDETCAIQRAVRGNADAMRYLDAGDPEVTLQWDAFGRQCKGRVDWLTTVDGEPVLVGLKTARDCRHYQFGSQAARLGYHLQWAYYFDGFKAITGKMAKVIEIVVEAEAPHAVVVYVIPDDILQQGMDEYLALLDQLAECERLGNWPGPSVGEQILTLPSWVYADDEDLSDLGLEA